MPASRVLEDFDIFSADKPAISKSELSNRLFGDLDSDDDDDDLISSKLFVQQIIVCEEVFLILDMDFCFHNIEIQNKKEMMPP